MKISSKRLSRVTSAERKVLNSLTLRGDSLMREDVLQKRDKLDTVQVFIARLDGKIIGWSCVYRDWYKHCNVYTYVAYAHRRHGYGKALFKAATAYAKRHKLDVTVFPWDTRSEKFFAATGAAQYVF